MIKDFKEIEVKQKWLDEAHDDINVLGELAVANLLDVELSKGEGYDLIYGDNKIDVITRLEMKKVKISPSYTAVIDEKDYNKDQDCNVYVFVRVSLDHKKLWIAGWISKEGFYNQAKFYNKGDKCGCGNTDNPGWKMFYLNLKPMDKLTKSLSTSSLLSIKRGENTRINSGVQRRPNPFKVLREPEQ